MVVMVMVVYGGNGDFHLQVMVVGMLHHPTIFYYPAIAVASVMVAVKVRKLIKASEMLVAPRISECFGLPWSALVCCSLL